MNDRLYTVREAADQLRVAPKTVLNILCAHPKEFPKRYQRISKHPRLHRMLTLTEIAQVQALLRPTA